MHFLTSWKKNPTFLTLVPSYLTTSNPPGVDCDILVMVLPRLVYPDQSLPSLFVFYSEPSLVVLLEGAVLKLLFMPRARLCVVS